MTLEEFKKATPEQLREYGKKFSLGITKVGLIKTVKTEDGYWCEMTYDENGNILTYKDSDGEFIEF